MNRKPTDTITIYTHRNGGVEEAQDSLECDGLPTRPFTIIRESRLSTVGRFFPQVRGLKAEENYGWPKSLTRDDLFVNKHLR